MEEVKIQKIGLDTGWLIITHIRNTMIEMQAMMDIGDFIEVNALNKSDYHEEIRKIIAEWKPDWVIAAGESATVCLSVHGQKKIQVNPIVTFDEFNNVPEYILLHTYVFFGALPQQQKSYEMFQAVYPNVTWYINVPNLNLINIKDII